MSFEEDIQKAVVEVQLSTCTSGVRSSYREIQRSNSRLISLISRRWHPRRFYLLESQSKLVIHSIPHEEHLPGAA